MTIPKIAFAIFLIQIGIWMPLCFLVLFDIAWQSLPFKQAALVNIYLLLAPPLVGIVWIMARFVRGRE